MELELGRIYCSERGAFTPNGFSLAAVADIKVNSLRLRTKRSDEKLRLNSYFAAIAANECWLQGDCLIILSHRKP